MVSLSIAIKDPVEKMEYDEKGLLQLVLTYGKKAEEEFRDHLNDDKFLEEYGKKMEKECKERGEKFYEVIAEKMNAAFCTGFGIMDELTGRYDNYGVQLEYLIDKVLVKALKVTKPYFKTDADSFEGAKEREKWIVEKLLESMWDRFPDEVKKELAKEIEKMLVEKGIDAGEASLITTTLIQGGLTAAKHLLGFQFHILLAQVSNLITKLILGRGLSVAVNAALQRVVGILFGPLGWIITAILFLPTIASLINPREYDKYIPVVFIIGLARISKEKKIAEEREKLSRFQRIKVWVKRFFR